MDEPREFDSPWKDALDEFLDSALALFFPELHAAVDWAAGYEPLVTELAEIVREGELGPTVADRLFKVVLLSGESVWLAVHVEIQSQHDSDLPRRMFVYHYRIADRYRVPVASLAILGDESATWRPDEYVAEQFGTGIRFRYRAVKLIDWRDRFADLADNPIAFVVAAHLRSLETADNPAERKSAKWKLIRSLFDAGGTPERVRKLYRLIDWFLNLPAELQKELRTDIVAYEEEKKMPYVISDERIARAEGRVEGMLEMVDVCLRLKFGLAGQAFADQFRATRPTHQSVTELKDAIESAPNLDALRKFLP